ncbi:flagellar protein FliT [Aquibacillus salsiterrae]|uniref:Flagellar protein FliT n=1 Tax=Aquibacillus salsiterrae TaxID=2950439 RepID=A0A9X3WB15_9BACI|nr:flagellar protein FliT [Aquibacillus salsiterrae]MDC3416135.1 flagellar protein FliT [Aquibacillus salsiterrae]
MNRLLALHETTVQLQRILSKEVVEGERDATLEQINVLLDEREQQLNIVQPPFSEDEQEVGEKLLPINQDIQVKMDELFSQIKQDVKSIKTQKRSNQTYTNPYQSLSNYDGMFLDHKK